MLTQTEVVLQRTAIAEGEKVLISHLPPAAVLKISQFLLDNMTGNVTLNVQRGRVLGFKVEEIVHLR
jgi:hypothetical protein